MNPVERIAKAVFDDEMSRIFGRLPATVIEYDADLQQAKLRVDVPGDDTSEELVLTGVPVQQYGSEKMFVVVQIDKGCEGMVDFCMRDFSQWLHGEEQPTARRFDINDATFTPGFRSQANALKNVENNGIQLIIDGDERRHLWLKKEGGIFTSEVIHCKSFVAEDDCTAKGEVLTRISHKHPYIDSKGSSATPSQSTTDPAEQ